jgi:hypothetical protein
MATNNIATSGGVGFTGLLFITFLVLKLTHVIDWSWWWVTAPLWGGIALVAAFFITLGVIIVISSGVRVLRK